MAAVVTLDELVARTQRMRDLSAADRVSAITGSDNVVGYDRFSAQARQVQATHERQRSLQETRR